MHVVVTRLCMVKFVYAERLALYLLDILFTYLYERIKNNELKVGSIINPTPMYLEQLEPIPALTAGSWETLMTYIFKMHVGPYAK